MTWLRQTGRTLRRVFLPAVAALAAATVAAPAEAAFIASFSGNTAPQHQPPGAGVAGTVNFAVYDRLSGGSVAGDLYGTGTAGIDALFVSSGTGGAAGATYGTGRYLYLYQTVNNGVASGSFPISTNTVFVSPGFVGTFGTLTGSSFSTTILGAPATPGDPSSASTGASPVISTGVAGLTTPTLALGATSLRAIYTPELTSGAKSVLYGYVSNQAPALFQTGLIDGGTTADGLAPSAAVPEPSAVILSLIGLPCGLLLRRRMAKV